LRFILVYSIIIALSNAWQASAQVLIKDFVPGPNTYSNVSELVSIRDTVAYLTYESSFFKTDGTCGGTSLVKDFGVGAPRKYTPAGARVYFSAFDVDHGYELWATGGTTASTYLVKDIYTGTSDGYPDHFCAYHNIVYFAATSSNKGEELWRSDGTAAGTSMVIDLRPGSTGSLPDHLTIYKDTLFFVATTSIGPALWKSDGTSAGTVLVKDFAAASTLGSGAALQVVGDKLFLKVNDNVHGTELWVSDGSTAGTYMVKDMNPGSNSGFMNTVPLRPIGNTVFFVATDGVHGQELWRSNGTEVGTVMVKDIYPLTSSSSITELIEVNNILYFDADSPGNGDELWRSDGTESGTYMVQNINPTPNYSSAPKYLTPVTNGFYFNAIDDVHGAELWWSDGTSGNTVLVKDIWPGTKSSSPSKLARIHEEVVFLAENDVAGEELWSTGPIPSGPPVDAVVSSITHEKCSGDMIGAIDITVTAGDCPFVFQWTGPYNYKYYTEDLTGMRAGIYHLTITDGKGTTKVMDIEITQPLSITAYITNQSPPDCLGNLGHFTIAAQGGTPPFDYLWENGVVGPTQIDIPLPGNNFNVSITDANGCVFDWGIYGTHAEIPHLPGNLVSHPISCYNDLAFLYVPQGVKPNESGETNTILYNWEAGPGGEIVSDPNLSEILVRGAASYYLTVTASTSSCTVKDTVIVLADFLSPVANAGPDVAMTCSTNEVLLNASASANGHPQSTLKIQWEALNGGHFVSSPFEVAPTIDRPGTYVMTVQNQYNGCITQDTVLVTSQFEGPTLSVSGSPLYCDQDEVTLHAVLDTSLAVFDGWYTEGGLYSSDVDLLMPEADGWAYVIAKASNSSGCTTEIRVDLLRNNQTSFLSLSADSLACGGVPIKVAYHYPYENLQWVWTGPYGYFYQGEDAYANDPGYYYLKLTAGNCTIYDTIEVVGQNFIQLRSYQIMPPSCSGSPDGQIILNGLWGAYSYNVVWSNGVVGTWNTNLAPGQYWADISSSVGLANECFIRKDFDLPYPDTMQISLFATPDTSGNSGTITSILEGVVPPPYFYQWSNGETTASITGLAPGIYTLTVTYNQDYNCTATSSVEVLSGACALEVTESLHQNNSCPGDEKGRIELNVTHGIAPYTYLWSNGANTPGLSDLASGVYFVTVSDDRNCSATLETTIITLDTTPPVLQLTQLTRSLDASGHLSLTAQDFDAGSYDNCSIASFEAFPTEFGCDDLGLRMIEVTATDAAGNVTSGQATLILQDNTPPKMSCPDNIVKGFCENAVIFNLPEVEADACIAYDPSQLVQLEGLPSGVNFQEGITNQVFSYTKPNGLSDTCSFTITIASEPAAIDLHTTDMSCFGECNGSVNIIVTGGASPFVYQWSSGQTDAVLTDLCHGQYEVSIFDAYNCGWSFSPIVQEPAELLIATDTVVDDTSSQGLGAIRIFASGGVLPYQFAWYSDSVLVDTTQNLEGLYAGDYYCVLTDANNCMTSSVLITVNDVVGTAEPAWAGGLSLVPNPASGAVLVTLPANTTVVPKIRVTDALGKPAYGIGILQSNAGQIMLDVSNAVPGIYWVQLIAIDGRVGRKLVVVH